MGITLGSAKRKTFLSMLVYGAPGTTEATWLGLPNPVVVDAHRVLGAQGDAFAGRILESSQPAAVNELIALLHRGTEKAGAFVIHGLSRIMDEIEVSTPENKSFFAQKRKRLTDLTDAARALPMHVAFTARSKDDYAKTGDVVNGYLVTPEDKVVTGSAPDIDRAIPYDVDVVLETVVDELGSYTAHVVSSHLSGLPVGMIIDNPNAEKILALANLAAPAPETVDFDTIDDKHEAYGTNPHLKHLADRVNDRLKLEGVNRRAPRAMLIEWKVIDGKSPLTAEQRIAAVAAFLKALHPVAATSKSTETSQAGDQPPAIGNEELKKLLADRNAAVTKADGNEERKITSVPRYLAKFCQWNDQLPISDELRVKARDLLLKETEDAAKPATPADLAAEAEQIGITGGRNRGIAAPNSVAS